MFLGDTVGYGTPGRVDELITAVKEVVPLEETLDFEYCTRLVVILALCPCHPITITFVNICSGHRSALS